MNGKIRRQLAILGALAALVAVLVPAGLASGSDLGTPVVGGGDPSFVLLTLGKTDEVTWNGLNQNVTSRRNDCVARWSGDTVLDITAEVEESVGDLGFVKDGFGVDSSGTGEPCGRVDADYDESISVALGADLDGYLMSAVDIDFELKFDAVVDVIFKHEGEEVATDSFGPLGGSDSGNDFGPNDNHRYFAKPGKYFDEVKFVAASGSFSLEGGADGTEDGLLDPETNNSSQFEVVPVFDGEITCQGDLEIFDPAAEGVVGALKMHSMQFDPEGEDPLAWYTKDCPLKPYNDGVTDDSLFFIPELLGTLGRYTITITIENQPITTNGDGRITSLTMQYNPDGDPTPLQALLACEAQPNTDTGDLGYEAFWTQSDVGLLPTGKSACYYGVSVTPTGIDPGTLETVGTEVWEIFFEDDPSFRFG